MPKREKVKWQNGNGCRACKTEFSMFTRKHHCRACGEVFCDDCSSHRMELAGHEEAVRICERCMKVQSGGQSWASDSSTKKCNHCRASFSLTLRKHHCRACGDIFCDDCSAQRLFLPHMGINTQERVCKRCHAKYKRMPGCDPEWGLNGEEEARNNCCSLCS